MLNSPELTVQRAAGRDLVRSLHQHWLHGFDNAYRAWPALTLRLREDIARLIDRLLPTLAINALPADLETETLQVQLFNVASYRGRDLESFIQSLSESEPPRTEGGWRIGLHRSPPDNKSGAAAWNDALLGLISAPHWNLITKAWAQLTPGYRKMLDDVFADKVPTPLQMTQPADLAWMDRVHRSAHPSDEQLLIAYRDLPAAFADQFASMLILQHSVWSAGRLIPISGCIAKIDDHVPNTLAQLACFHAPFGQQRLDEIRAVGITYPPGIFGKHSTKGEHSGPGREYLDQGITLVPRSKASAPAAPAATAGHPRLVPVKSSEKTLLNILDIDLTRPEMSFLGLKGTRLRICDYAGYTGTPCVTRVTLDGDVELVSNEPPPDAESSYPGAEEFVSGRTLVSPFEGMSEAGYTGSRERIGGAPAWEQRAEFLLSPASGKAMTFIAQFPHPIGGTAYVFLDFQHLLAAVASQSD